MSSCSGNLFDSTLCFYVYNENCQNQNDNWFDFYTIQNSKYNVIYVNYSNKWKKFIYLLTLSTKLQNTKSKVSDFWNKNK